MSNKIKKIESHVINDYSLKIESENDLFFSKGDKKFYIYAELLDFMPEKSYALKFDKEETIENLNQFLDVPFSILNEMQNIFNDISFIYSYSFGRQVSLKSKPYEMSDVIEYFYTGEDFFLIDTPIYDINKVDKIANIDMSIIFCTVTNKISFIYNLVVNKVFSFSEDTYYLMGKNREEIVKELLFLFAAKPLDKPVNDLLLSDHVLLKMLNI